MFNRDRVRPPWGGRTSRRPRTPHLEGAPLRALVRRFWPFTRGLRRWILLGTILVAALPVVQAVEIWLFKLLVDDVLVPRDLGPLPALALAYIALNLASGALSFADEWIATATGERFLLRVRKHVFEHLLRLSPVQIGRHRLGDLLSRLSGDVAAIESFVVTGASSAVEAGVKLLVFAGMLVWLDPVLALVALVGAPLFWLLARRFSRAVRAASLRKRRRTGALQSIAEEVLAGLAHVQAASTEPYEWRRHERENEAVVRAELDATRIRALFGPLVDLLELLGGLAVVCAGAWSLANGRLTLGELLAFMTYLTQVYGPVRDLSHLSASVFKAAAGGERVVELLDEVPAVRDPASPHRLDRISGGIAFRDVTYTYPGADAPALARVSFTARPGTLTAIVGASGSGKSTLVSLLLRFLDPDSGSVTLDGHDLRALELVQVRAAVGALLQDTYLFDGSVRDNVVYAQPQRSDDDVRRALEIADAADFVALLPARLKHPLGPKGAALSGGQRRRIALARAILDPRPVLVLDEYSTGLDPQSARRVLAELTAQRMRTTILITHDLEVARAADNILVLKGGRIVEQGAPERLEAAGGRFVELMHRATMSALQEVS